ncbi:hypothetical protein [Actinomadura parmotrematis]|uniref:DUF4386 domain-containing protein n=1 Tax=Actinomadura parmotrematis TaxID=2864039 RepID=A0ABS7FVW0_9ACTN|nr:hypothetical protein [Actinomadura parmotrematis]MBW8484566.1 hypothetical protein [Actinomadura parmotrematis]
MNLLLARRLTGTTGLAAAVALLLEVPLYFVYSGAPPASNVLSRLLIGVLALGCVLAFALSFRELVGQADPRHAWIGRFAGTAGPAYAVVTLVSSGLEAGAVIASDHPIDPTITVTGTYILYGAIGRMLMAMFLGSVGLAILRTSILPHWAGLLTCALALLNLAFLPSLFFGSTPAHFYAANGWGTTALMGAIFSWWLLGTSLALLRHPKPPTT